MKRIFTAILVLLMLLPLCACGNGKLSVDETKTAEKTVETKEEQKEKKEDGKIVYPEDFSVGFGRTDITPKDELPIYDGTASSAHDPLQITATAFCDGESAALLISVDVRSIRINIAETCQRMIERSLGIPADRVLLNATHTHSAPAPGFDNDENANHWVETVFYKQVVAAAKGALLDLTPAEAFAGVSHTDGITFVRRYLMESGKYQCNPTSGTPVAHESEADNEMRVIRFEREGKKDVLMVNYQTHYGDSPNRYPNQYSSDFVHTFREKAEKELDCLFTYHSGASGNLNFNGKLPGEKKYGNFVEATEGLMLAAKDAIAKEEKVKTGTIRAASSKYVATTIKDSEERYKHAVEVNTARGAGKSFTELLYKYNFASKYEATAVIMRKGLGENPEIPFTAITCGDLAFVSAPYEMFDTNGQEVRAASPYKMTFICSLTNGSFGYVPSAQAVPHGSYEVITTYFEYGSAEKFAAEMVRLLNECKNAA